MIDATEILPAAPRLGIARVRPADGLTVEIVALAGVLLLLLAIVVAGGARPGSTMRAEAPRAAAVAVPAAAQPVGAAPAVARVAAVPITAGPAIVAGRTPNVIGMSREAAAAALLAAGYRSVSWVQEAGHAGRSGSVVRHEPVAGSPLPPGATARLIVAR